MKNWRWTMIAASLLLVAACNGGAEQAGQSAGEAAQKPKKAEEAEQPAGEASRELKKAEEAKQASEPADPSARTGKTGEPRRGGDLQLGAGNLIQIAINGDHRDEGNSARDEYRNPGETLEFFGLEPDMTVIELYPGGGWYTEILAPVLRHRGQLITAGFSEDSEVEYYRKSARAFNEKLAADPDIYGDVEQIVFMPPDQVGLGEPESADMVLTFRNLHNWHERGALGAVFEEAYNVLEPGGVFGVVEHRAAEGVTIDEVKETGYMPEDYVIDLAEDTGFRLEASSDINANPADTGDHPMGVWTLPPTLRHCEEMDDGKEKTECMEKYKEIGESDRMTLKFVKPATE